MNWILGFLLGFLIVDGFPAGADLLREFGSRPLNIFLAVFGFFFLLKESLGKRGSFAIGFSDYHCLIALLILVPLINVPTAIIFSPVGLDEVIETWLKQYLMLVWACLSYYIWRQLLSSRTEQGIAIIAVLASIPALAMFYVELVSPESPFMVMVDILRFKEDERPSSFATEPSIYASWTLVIWPLALLLAGAGKTSPVRWLGRTFLAGVMLSIFLCNARTAAGIGVFQVIFFLLWATRRGRIGIGTAIGVFAVVSVMPLVLARLLTITDLQSNLSNIGRIGSTVTGVLVTVDHPILGIGIGQFKYFLGSYAPAFAQASQEISAWGDGSASFRASTFNLFVRLLCEFGLVVGGVACWLLSRPLITAFLKSENLEQVCIALSAVGGFGFWLIQDQYAYQPGIFAFVLLLESIRRAEVRS